MIDTKAPFESQIPLIPSAALLGRNWGWFVFRGVLALLFGVFAFAAPISAAFALALVFVAYAAVDGVAAVIAGVRGATHHAERWPQLVLSGALGIAVAVLFLIMPGVATLSYALLAMMLLVGWAILTGVVEISAAIRLRETVKGEWLLGLSGVLSVLLGVFVWVALLRDPLASIVSVAWLVGAYALFAGVALIAFGLRVKRLAAR